MHEENGEFHGWAKSVILSSFNISNFLILYTLNILYEIWFGILKLKYLKYNKMSLGLSLSSSEIGGGLVQIV